MLRMRLGKAVRNGTEEAHESCEADERDVARLEIAHEDRLERLACRVVAMGDGERVESRGACALETLRVRAVGDDHGDFGPQPPVRSRVDQRLEIAPPP